MIKKTSIFIIAFILILFAFGCDQNQYEKYSAEFIGPFDTYTKVIGYTASEDEFNDYANYIFEHLNEFHKLYTIYDTYDDLNNIKTINDNAGIQPVQVDQAIIDLLLFGKEMYDLTDGSVNIAMGSVLEIWHDYREAGTTVPPIDILVQAGIHTNIDNMIIDQENKTVYLTDPEMSLDVGAIAKGFATEIIAEEIQSQGFSSGIISVGGNVKIIGKPMIDEQEYWHVGIQDPDDYSGIYATIDLNDTSLVTSGDYERYYIIDGIRYSHIIDKQTLMPATYYRSVTIITDNSAMADVLSTALFTMSYDDGLTLISSLDDVECFWINADNTTKNTDGLDNLIQLSQ